MNIFGGRQIGIPKIELKVLKMSWIYADQCAAGGIPTFMCHVDLHVRVCDDGTIPLKMEKVTKRPIL